MTIPHMSLIDEIALTLIPINLQLQRVNALLKWLSHIEETNDASITHPTHWIAALNPRWTFLFEEKLQGLVHLQEFINDMEKPLIQLMEAIGDFSSYKEIQTALYTLQQSYAEIPYIETEVALLSNGCNILEQKELLPTLLYYFDRVTSFAIQVEHLKEAAIHAAIHTASDFFSQHFLPLTEQSRQAADKELDDGFVFGV